MVKLEADRARLVPFGIAAVALVAGVVIAFGVRRDDPAPVSSAPLPHESAAPSATVEQAPEDDEYTPDLGGDDIGEVIVADAVDAHAIAVVGKRLLWFQTEGAALSSAELDGSGVVLLHKSGDDRFGGAFASDGRGIYWTIAGGQNDPIHYTEAKALDREIALGEPWFVAGSPSELDVADGVLRWADRGDLYTRDGKLAARDKRIETLTHCDGTLFWFEVPFEGEGASELWELAEGGEPARVWRGTSAAHRRDLVCAGKVLAWAEDDAISKLPISDSPAGGGTPSLLARAGGVGDMLLRNGLLWWSEVHGEGDDAVSLFRSVPLAGGRAVRIGRTRGHVSALHVHVGYLYWSGPRGLSRAPVSATKLAE